MKQQISVMLTTEGTYPFHTGGVSTWCHQLIESLPEVEVTVFSIIMDPFVSQRIYLAIVVE